MKPMLPILILAVLLLLAAGCTQSTAPSAGQDTASGGGTTANTPVQAADGRILAAYWFLNPDPNGDTYSLVMSSPDTIPWTKINRLYLGFATLKDGVLVDLPTGSSADDATQKAEMQRRIREVVSLCREKNPNAEIFISSNFGGNDIDSEYNAAAQDPQKFADSALAYLKEYDLDGYDMDWESRSIDDYAPALTSLLSACHTTFAGAGTNPHGRSYKVTHTVWPGVESPQTVAGLKDAVDQINIMSYGTGDTYDLVSYADSYATAGFPCEKMIGGLEAERDYPENGGHDTLDSVSAKCTYVKSHNLAGLFVWRLDNDMREDNAAPTYLVTGWMNGCLAG